MDTVESNIIETPQVCESDVTETPQVCESDVHVTFAMPVGATVVNTDKSLNEHVADGGTFTVGDCIITNSDDTFHVSVPATKPLTLPDVEHTDSNGDKVVLPAITPFVAAPVDNGRNAYMYFHAQYEDYILITADANMATTWMDETLSNVATVSYKKNSVAVSLPFTLAVGDTLKVEITRTDASLDSLVKLKLMINDLHFESKLLFNSTDFAGCQLWLKADAGITKDGSNKVSLWADQSGNNNHAVQSNWSKQPLYVDNQLNGYGALQFDGIDDFMEFNEVNIRTYYIVIRHRTGTSVEPPAIMGHDVLYDLHGGYGNLLYNNEYSPLIFNGLNVVNSVVMPALDIIKPTTYTLICCVTSGIAKAKYIANDRNIQRHYWDGYYAEILLYDTIHSTAERQLVENYLNTKYALW